MKRIMCNVSATAVALALCVTAQDIAAQAPATAQAGPVSDDDVVAKLLPGPGYDVTMRTCTGCHGLEILATKPPQTPWGVTVQSMSDRGAPGSPADLAQIVDYLEATLP